MVHIKSNTESDNNHNKAKTGKQIKQYKKMLLSYVTITNFNWISEHPATFNIKSRKILNYQVSETKRPQTGQFQLYF